MRSGMLFIAHEISSFTHSDAVDRGDITSTNHFDDLSAPRNENQWSADIFVVIKQSIGQCWNDLVSIVLNPATRLSRRVLWGHKPHPRLRLLQTAQALHWLQSSRDFAVTGREW